MPKLAIFSTITYLLKVWSALIILGTFFRWSWKDPLSSIVCTDLGSSIIKNPSDEINKPTNPISKLNE